MTKILETYSQLQEQPAIYKNQAVRDLIWAVLSPDLSDQLMPDSEKINLPTLWHPDLNRNTSKFFETTNTNSSELDKLLSNSKSHFLGPYFEALWSYFICNNPDYHLIAQNLQTHHQGKTLGELDFLIKDLKRDKFIHLELAVKFYLEVKEHPIETPIYCSDTAWIGPNKIDRLDKKLDSLINKQLRQPQNPHTQRQLEQLGVQTLDSAAILKGYLFKKIEDLTAFCHQIKTRNSQNYGWIGINELPCLAERLSKNLKGYWKELPKKQWFSPHYCEHPNEDCITNHPHKSGFSEFFSEIRDTIEREQRPKLLTYLTQNDEFKPSDQAGGLTESGRIFVTPVAWPH